MRVLICGGGLVGVSIAYFLALRGAQPIVFERTGLACAASGKAGGFLALDWCDGTPLQQLARRSFALHAQLARELEGEWGYRRLTTSSGIAGEGGAAERRSRGLDWLAEDVALDRRLGSTETTAQVHPGEMTRAMMGAAESLGAELRAGEVTGIRLMADSGHVAGIEIAGETVAGDAVVVALGPWSILAAGWLPLPAVYGSKGHSIVFDTGDKLGADALFLDAAERGTGHVHAPEIFPRPDGTTWVCAISSDSPLPFDPAAVAPDPGVMTRLRALCGRISPALAESRVVVEQACFRPVTQDGLPLIGAVPGVRGAYVAAGHSVWGILNAPATGEAMAELILDGAARSVDLSPFDPFRLPRLDPARLHLSA
jgi:glycine/D-amino acid oxidase-like deaminating enzyme